MEEIIGRSEERRLLTAALNSTDAELIAVYGRRRIGKTFLVRNHYRDHLVFEFTGVHEGSLKSQLHNFSTAMQVATKATLLPAAPLNWIEAFRMLTQYLKRKAGKRPKVILLDELPWICTPRSGFLQAFSHWWNTWASRDPLIKVVICGSAASWIITNIINDQGGLHNRVTQRIPLLPFTLAETESYLHHRGIKIDRYQMLQIYMAMGGVPQYLKQVKKGDSAAQTIDKLCFTRNGYLKLEFESLYRSLFAHSERHKAIVKALSRKSKGLARAEIIKACGFTTGGWTSELFYELEQSGFITQYIPFDRKLRDSIYKLSDEFSLFYLKFMEGSRATGPGTWLRLSKEQSYKSWCGFAFEAVCQKHTDQMKHKLGISGVYTEASAWRHIPGKSEKGAQVDLLLDRADHCINLCEMKYAANEFVIDKKYALELDDKIRIFKEQTKTKKTIFPTLVTTYGARKNEHYTGRIVAEIVMDDLFA